jgi:hypothetical protein
MAFQYSTPKREQNHNTIHNENANTGSDTSSTAVAEKNKQTPPLSTERQNFPAATMVTSNRSIYSPRDDGKIILNEDEVRSELGFGFPSWKKW